MRFVTFNRLEAVSIFHSCIYAALIVCAITLGSASTATYTLGWAHGLLWIGMSLVCIAAARARIIPFWLAVTVAVLGGLGPFLGTIGFLVETRRRRRGETLLPGPGNGGRTPPISRYS
jgi:pheromone shutdown protein TraB